MRVRAALRELVWQRAGGRCEYCRVPTSMNATGFCVDHVIPQKHGGKTSADNLALSCFECNSFKLDNLTGIDPATAFITRLFNPRVDHWSGNFRWRHAVLE